MKSRKRQKEEVKKIRSYEVEKKKKTLSSQLLNFSTSHPSGFTLVEVMIAMVVLLLGMLGVMGMQYFAISGNTASRELRTGTNLSAEIMEEMKGTPYANLASGTNLPATGQAISGAMTGLTRAWWVVPNCVALGPNGNTCAAIPAPACAANPDAAVVSPVSAIRTRTCWTDTDGTIHSVELDTLRWDENVIP